MVQTPGNTEPAITVVLKHMPSHVKLAIELGCSLAAMALKLPVPRGMLALANPQDLVSLPTDVPRLSGRPEVLCFASELRWPETARVRAGDPAVDEHLWQQFCETATASPSAAWDELVANGDRHAGNFIFDGTGYWLIDHDLALRPLAEAVKRMTDVAVRANILNHREKVNQVAAQLIHRRPRDHAIQAQPKQFEAKATALEALAARMPHWRTGIDQIDAVFVDAETVVRGIILRLPALALQLSDRLSKPASLLQWSTTNA